MTNDRKKKEEFNYFTIADYVHTTATTIELTLTTSTEW